VVVTDLVSFVQEYRQLFEHIAVLCLRTRESPVTGEKCIVRNFVIHSLGQMLLGRGNLWEEDELGTNPARACEEYVPLNFKAPCLGTTTVTSGVSGLILLKLVSNVCHLSLSVTCVNERPRRWTLSVPQNCRV